MQNITETMKEAIEASLAGARAEVAASSPGHFTVRVVSDAFAGKSRVQQQQLVYSAIAHLMKGDHAPVHAIDKLEIVLP